MQSAKRFVQRKSVRKKLQNKNKNAIIFNFIIYMDTKRLLLAFAPDNSLFFALQESDRRRHENVSRYILFYMKLVT